MVALPDLLDEQLLNKPVRLPVVRVVVSLAGLADPSELRQAKRAAGLPESLERVFGLAGKDDIAYQAKEVALADRVGQVTGSIYRCAEGPLEDACARRTQFVLIVFQHSLVVAHGRYVACTEIAEARVFGLCCVVLQSLEKGVMLCGSVVHLGFEKVVACIHCSSVG